MNTKMRFLSITMMLAFMVGIMLPWTQMKAQAADVSGSVKTELTITDETLYQQLKASLTTTSITDNSGVDAECDDTAQTIKLNIGKVTHIKVNLKDVSMSDNAKTVLQTLLMDCVKLKNLSLLNVDLQGVDLSGLNNRASLEVLKLYHCGLTEIPDITLPNLEGLYLSNNDLSGAGACRNIDTAHFANLKALVMDTCGINDLSFLGGVQLAQLKTLDLSQNKLTDEDLDQLIAAKDGLPELTTLRLGGRSRNENDTTYLVTQADSTNKLKEVNKLASLLTVFPNLTNLDLTTLGITSLRDFADVGVGDDVDIDFTGNKISDFAGLEGNRKIIIAMQRISLSGNFAPGYECELPELVKKVLDANDPLYGNEKIAYENCSLSADGTKLVVHPNVGGASMQVTGGRLGNIGIGSKITFQLKKVPKYDIPQDITAEEGKTLADIALPEGFAWKDDTLAVGEVGTKNFKAVYTPADLDAYIVLDNIDIPVMVTAPEKLLPNYTIPQDLTATEGDTLESVALPEGFSWKNAAQDVGAAGIHIFKASYTPEDTDKYQIVEIDLQVTVKEKSQPQKQKPVFTIPTGLTAVEGNTLADIALPGGFSWEDAAQDVGTAGEHTFMAVYTPDDTEKYIVVENIAVPVTVKAKETNAEPVVTPAEGDDDSDTDANMEEAPKAVTVTSAKTSDTSPILPAVILLVFGAAVCGTVSGVVIYKKRKTM
ncbi:MAG: hypothetical protein NC251_09220 [Lachnoclostridium sp.]|nr:hypothetical protein [Lachnospira sp.]MCM1248597.1 hypothetical protein [Lachnoclostridium sp.]